MAIDYYKKSIRDSELKKIEKFDKGCWINVIDPDETELKYLENEFKLDDQNLLSGIDKHEIPRAEFEEEGNYIILKTINPNDKKETNTILIVIGNDYILTLSKYQPKFITTIINKKDKIITTQKLKTLLYFLSEINNEFEKATLEIVKNVDKTKDSVMELRDKDINELLKQEDALNNFISAYTYSNRVYERMLKNIKFFEEDEELLDDLIIEGKEIHNLCLDSLRTISNIRNHFEILMSNKLNRVITLLTVFTILISIPAAISGIYGMNISLPLQNNPLAFYYIIVIALAIIGLFLFFLKKKKVI
jgi:magnesium transporter